MNQLIERVWGEAYGAWRFRWVGLSVAAVLAALGWLLVFALPDRYEASASVFVDSRTALRPVLQGLTMEQDVSVQLNYARQSLLSGERLEKIARESGVIPANETDPRVISDVLGGFLKRVTLEVRNASPSGREAEREAGAIYTVRFQDESRERSLKVVGTMLDTFVEETLGGKRAGAENAQRFLESEMKELEGRLRAAENRLADFKKANVGLMPAEQGSVAMQLQGAGDSAAQLERDLAVALSRRAELARQLRGDAVIAATSPSVAGAGANDTMSRINEAQARHDELLLRFTDRHPDVVAARSTLEDLKQRREREIEQLRMGDAGAAASSGISGNPVYQGLQQQLGQADLEIASLRGQIAQYRRREAELRGRMDVAMRVEAEEAQLNRDYEVVKAQYTAMLQNYEKAQLGERADDAGSVRFEVVQPPTAPYGPAFPPRMLLLLGTFVVSLAAGAALAWLLQRLRPVVASVHDLSRLTDLPVLGAVSPAFPREMAASARAELFRFLGAGGAFAATFVLVVVLNSMGIRLGQGAP